jgi:hypothetical protein
MRVQVEVRSSGPGPRVVWEWVYQLQHPALRMGKVLRYWIKAQRIAWPRDGVAVVIRRAP